MVNISPTKLAEITRLLDKSGIPWGVFGGAAARIYGATRPLKDIDILITSDSGDRVAEFFPTADLDYRADGSIWSLKLPDYDIIAGLTKYIDFEMDSEMAARIRRCELLGVELPVLSIEDNIAFKALMGRGPEVGKHDWEDAAVMLKNKPDLDWAYLRQRLQICAPEKVESICSHLDEINQGA